MIFQAYSEPQFRSKKEVFNAQAALLQMALETKSLLLVAFTLN